MTKQRYALRIGNGILGSVLIGCFLAGGLAGGYAAGLPSQSSEKPAPPQPTPPTDPFVLPGDPFAFHGKHNIMQEAHFGIGRASAAPICAWSCRRNDGDPAPRVLASKTPSRTPHRPGVTLASEAQRLTLAHPRIRVRS
ncbi:MAG TPA: hypothetical protein PK777_08245 [Thermoguttaceae bacterium]|nr:hypothetical protein [Thermoguttaceae bacterium]